MPLALVIRDAEVISNKQIHTIGCLVQNAVAYALDVEGNKEAGLTPKDVEVIVRDVRHGVDVGSITLGIVVFANDYPERRVNLDERRMKIETILRKHIPACGCAGVMQNGRSFVWVQLGHGSFGFL